MILFRYSIVFSSSIKFRSYADITAKSDNPIFVDDVLGITCGILSSCTLSVIK